MTELKQPFLYKCLNCFDPGVVWDELTDGTYEWKCLTCGAKGKPQKDLKACMQNMLLGYLKIHGKEM